MARGQRQRDRELAAEIERLYGLPLAEFTAARNALSTRLRKEGEAAEADRVKSLAKPTPSAWAVNRLMREDRAAFDALLAAGERARAAQAEVAAGKTGPDEMRKALAAQRERRDELKARAARLLGEGGRKATGTQLERLSHDFDALALDPAAAAGMGRLLPARPPASRPQPARSMHRPPAPPTRTARPAPGRPPPAPRER